MANPSANCTRLPLGGPNYFAQLPNPSPADYLANPNRNNMRFLIRDIVSFDWYSEMSEVDVYLAQYTPGQPQGAAYPPLIQIADHAFSGGAFKHIFQAVSFNHFGNGTDSTLYYLVARNRSNATAPCAEFVSGLFNISAPDTDYKRVYGIGLGVGLGLPLFITLIALAWALLALRKQSVREKSASMGRKLHKVVLE